MNATQPNDEHPAADLADGLQAAVGGMQQEIQVSELPDKLLTRYYPSGYVVRIEMIS
jgi:hypothetical protein